MVSPQAKREAVVVLMNERCFGVTRAMRADRDLTITPSVSQSTARFGAVT